MKYRRTAKRRNPTQGAKRPKLGQWLLKLHFPMNDPIVELGAAWAAGVAVDSRMIRQAFISAERWREHRDNRMASFGRAVARKLTDVLSGQEAVEDRAQFKHKAGSLVGSYRYNPKRKKAKSKRKSSKRRNPIKEDWHIARMLRAPKLTGKKLAALKRKLGRTNKRKLISCVLGPMTNPRGRGRGGKKFTKVRRGRKWESTVAGSLPWFANPRKSRRNPAQFPMPFVSSLMNPGKRKSRKRSR